jgi:hypothetical protein
MGTLAEIEAPIPKLNAQELADLERLVQAERPQSRARLRLEQPQFYTCQRGADPETDFAR